MVNSKKLVEQIDGGQIVLGIDPSPMSTLDKMKLIERHLSDSYKFSWESKNQPYKAVVERNGCRIDLFIYMSTVSYLGHPHPVYKKRIQISTSSDTSYLSTQINKKQCVLLLGVYCYNPSDPLIVAWEPERNQNPGKSKSCHVFTSDLLLGSVNGVHQRMDSRKNTVYVFKPEYLSEFVDFYIERKPIGELSFTVKGAVTKINHLDLLYNKLKYDLEINENQWDGKMCVMNMKSASFPHWAQSEWQGFYFEFFAKKYFGSIIEMPGPRFGNTVFDSFANIPWDFKVHSFVGGNMGDIPANDIEAIMEAIKFYGKVGFIVLVGVPEYEKSFEFSNWQSELKGGLSKYRIQGLETGRRHRKRKIVFRPSQMLGIVLSERDIVNHKRFQGNMRNAGGGKRNTKLSIVMANLDENNIVFSREF